MMKLLSVSNYFKLLFLLAICLLSSCQDQKRSNSTDILIEKVNKLENDILKNNTKIKDLETINDFNKRKIEEYELEFIRKDDVKFLLADKYFYLINKNNLIQYFYDELKRFHEKNYKKFHEVLWEFDSLFKPDSNVLDYKKSDTFSYIRYITSRFDRSPESIKNFLNLKNKTYLFSIFKNNNLYKNSGLKLFVKSLILAYEENLYEEKKMRYLFIESQNYMSIYDDYNSAVELANSYATESMLLLIDEENKNTDGNEIYTSPEKLNFYIYSFWSRRYNENNHKAVYDFLKEFDEEVN